MKKLICVALALLLGVGAAEGKTKATKPQTPSFITLAKAAQAATTGVCKGTDADDRLWLAKTLYFETLRGAKGTSREMVEIAQVVLNRLKSGNKAAFGGPRLCHVVTKIGVGKDGKPEVQFSWILYNLNHKPRGTDWALAQKIARDADLTQGTLQSYKAQFQGALFYRNKRVKVSQRSARFFGSLTDLGKLAHHNYYCRPGQKKCGLAVVIAAKNTPPPTPKMRPGQVPETAPLPAVPTQALAYAPEPQLEASKLLEWLTPPEPEQAHPAARLMRARFDDAFAEPPPMFTLPWPP